MGSFLKCAFLLLFVDHGANHDFGGQHGRLSLAQRAIFQDLWLKGPPNDIFFSPAAPQAVPESAENPNLGLPESAKSESRGR